MKPILMRMGCAGSRPYSSQAFWPLLLLAMGVAVGGMGLGVRAELLDPTPEYEFQVFACYPDADGTAGYASF